MSFLQTPSKWNSVFRPVVYQHQYDTAYFSSVSSVSGFAKFNLSLTTSTTGIRRIYIASGAYAGWHTVTANTATSFTTSTAYGATATGTLTIIEDTQFEIYVGYPSGTYAVENPERLIATIQPAPNLTGQLYFDIAEYLKAAWANDGYAPMVAPPANGVDVNMSTPFRVETLGKSASDGDYYYAAYATIPTGKLNDYSYYGVFLSIDTPVLFSCGCTILSQILDFLIYNHIICDGSVDTSETKLFQDGSVFEFQDGETFIYN